MTKKSVKMEADYSAQAEEARKRAIAQFNLENEDNLFVDENRIPTEEDCDKAKLAFEERMKAVQEKKDYVVADEANALRVAKFMKEFVDNSFWTQRFWVGVINFSKLLEDFIAECEKTPKALVLEYPALQFCQMLFEQYAGFGLEEAKKMASIWDEYVPIHDTLADLVNEYNDSVKECEVLQKIWNMMEQGYYTIQLEPKKENVQAEELSEGKEQ